MSAFLLLARLLSLSSTGSQNRVLPTKSSLSSVYQKLPSTTVPRFPSDFFLLILPPSIIQPLLSTLPIAHGFLFQFIDSIISHIYLPLSFVSVSSPASLSARSPPYYYRGIVIYCPLNAAPFDFSVSLPSRGSYFSCPSCFSNHWI